MNINRVRPILFMVLTVLAASIPVYFVNASPTLYGIAFVTTNGCELVTVDNTLGIANAATGLSSGTHTIQAIVDPGYVFDTWITAGAASVGVATSASTTLTLSGSSPTGTLMCYGQMPGNSVGAILTNLLNGPQTLGFERPAHYSDPAGLGYIVNEKADAVVISFHPSDTGSVKSNSQLAFDGYSNALVAGASSVNPTTNFYMNRMAPLTMNDSDGSVHFKLGPTTVLSDSLVSSTSDDFVIETFQDQGHWVVLVFGTTPTGTLAAGMFLRMNDGWQSNLDFSSLTKSVYIVHWQSAFPFTGDPTPTTLDSYTITYSS